MQSFGSPQTTFLLTKLDREGSLRQDGKAAERFRKSLERQRRLAEREMRGAVRKANRSNDHAAAAVKLADMRASIMRNYVMAMRAYYGNVWFKQDGES
ncbi:MAG: hypothetical protein AAF764_08995 [Pseudomonadota bacterium]